MSIESIRFPDIDPYATLELSNDAEDSQIKKSYRRLMLRYHPDKLSNDLAKEEAQDRFHKVQFSYEVLTKFREIYDKSGSIEACYATASDSLGDWKDLFEMDTVVTRELIDEDRQKYRGSQDEIDDIVESWSKNGPVPTKRQGKKKVSPDEDQFTLLFQEIPHLEATGNDEAYMFNRISELLERGTIVDTQGSFARWRKSRKKLLRSLQKRLENEESLAKEMLSKLDKEKQFENEKSLQQVILKKNKNNWDSLIAKLENEASDKRGKKKKRSHVEIDEDEFERIQQDILKRRK